MCYPNGGNDRPLPRQSALAGSAIIIVVGLALNLDRAHGGIGALAARLPGNMSVEPSPSDHRKSQT